MADATVQTIEIEASAETLFDVAADLASYPDWASGVKAVQIHETDADGLAERATFTVDGMVKEITYTLRYTYERPHRIAWEAEPGDDINAMVGSYEFTATEDGPISVVYALSADPAFKIPGFVRRQVERQIVGTALRGLRSRVQVVSAGE